jgi:hypothetical protein
MKEIYYFDSFPVRFVLQPCKVLKKTFSVNIYIYMCVCLNVKGIEVREYMPMNELKPKI